jgi:hypothetical protein
MPIITLDKDHHYSSGPGTSWGLSLTNLQAAEVRFKEDCRYNIGEDQLDWNKLFGRTTSDLFHQNNSMRVGWRYRLDIDQIELGAYTYRKGERQIEIAIDPRTGAPFDISLGLVHLEEPFYVSCAHEKDEYIFYSEIGELQNKKVLPANKQCDLYPSSKLSPYFGGNRRAPHTMHIDISFQSR